jgi:hypothetical protein
VAEQRSLERARNNALEKSPVICSIADSAANWRGRVRADIAKLQRDGNPNAPSSGRDDIASDCLIPIEGFTVIKRG